MFSVVKGHVVHSLLNSATDSTVREIQDTPVNQKILEELETLLEEQFGKTWPEIRFAVRSSALGKHMHTHKQQDWNIFEWLITKFSLTLKGLLD